MRYVRLCVLKFYLSKAFIVRFHFKTVLSNRPALFRPELLALGSARFFFYPMWRKKGRETNRARTLAEKNRPNVLRC